MKPIEVARQEMTAAAAKAEHSDFMTHMGKVLGCRHEAEKGAGHLHGRLAGPKKHMRMWCDGTCNSQMME